MLLKYRMILYAHLVALVAVLSSVATVPAQELDIGKGSKGEVELSTDKVDIERKSTLKATTPARVNSLDMPDLHIDPNIEQIKTAPDAGENSSINLKTGTEPVCSIEGVIEVCVSELTHLYERILQLPDTNIKDSLEDDGY